MTTEQTLAEFITVKGIAATLDLSTVQLSWLPDPKDDIVSGAADIDKKPQGDSTIGYSFALWSIVKSLLEPDRNIRWSAAKLKQSLGKDPSSPLIANLVAATQIPTVGEPLTVDNVQLGTFVQHGRDWEDSNSCFEAL